jgi:Family of unknown function (DUF6152)
MTRNDLLALALVILSVTSVGAHHAFSPVYDEKRMVTVDGVVTEFRFVNPHSMMTVEVRDESGTVTKWVVEFAGRLNLSEVGWTADTIKTGEKVSVTGNPTWEKMPRLFFQKLVRPDGTELVRGAPQLENTLEAERRQRARERDQRK